MNLTINSDLMSVIELDISSHLILDIVNCVCYKGERNRVTTEGRLLKKYFSSFCNFYADRSENIVTFDWLK